MIGGDNQVKDPTMFVTPNYLESLKDVDDSDMSRRRYGHMLTDDECACSYFEPGTIVMITAYPGAQPITLKVTKHISQGSGGVHAIEFSEANACRLNLDLDNDVVWVQRAS